MLAFLDIAVTMAVGFGLFFGVIFSKSPRDSLWMSLGLAALSAVGLTFVFQRQFLPFMENSTNWFLAFTRGVFLLVGLGSALLSFRDLRRGIRDGI
jgi:hypothetical protein